MPMTAMKKSVLLAVAAAGALSACGYDIPLATHLPKVDGVLAKGEWDEGVRLACFLSSAPLMFLQPGNEGFATFLTDGKTLFVAWRVKAHNVDIGGGMKANATQRDGAVWDDDAVELVVAGDDEGRVAHFIVNCNNVIWDRLATKGGKADIGWNCPGLKVAGRVLHGWWDLELAVPLKSIGAFTKGVSVNAASSVSGEGPASLTASGDYVNGPKVRFDWRKGASAVQITSVGNPGSGEWRPAVVLASGASGAKVRVDFQIREAKDSGEDGPVLFAESGTIGVGETFVSSFDTRSRSLLHAEMTVRDATTGAMLIDRSFFARRGNKSSGVPPTAEFDVGELGEACVFSYPGMGKVRFTFHPAPGKGVAQVQCRLGGKTVKLAQDGGSYTVLADAPKAEGKYPVDFAVRSGDGVSKFPSVWTLEKRRFEWEGNAIGKERVIIPPFKPVAAEGDALSVILRRYAFGAAGLPKSVITLDREILADGGIHYELEADGRTTRFKGAAPKFTVRDGGYSVDVVSVASADGVTLSTKGSFEYDGFLWNEVKVSGAAGRSLDRLTLVIPLRDAEAPLLHICTTDTIRSNPSGAVPAGEGVVWDGTKLSRWTGFADNMFADQVVPYVWLGAEKRGLCWFLNNTAGLRIAKDRASVRIVRERGVLRLEIDLVNVPSRLADGHVFAYGFEATPVKLADKSMRRHFQTEPGTFPKGMIPRQSMRTDGFFNDWARRPYNDDWSFMAAALKRANTGRFRTEYLAAYTAFTNRYDKDLAAYASQLPDIGQETHFDWMRSCRAYSVTTLLQHDEPSYPFRYSDPTLNWMNEEAVPYYKSEWISRPTGYHGATRNFLTPSYLDYILYYYKKWQDLGMKGMYFDDMFPMTCRNPDTCMVRDDAGRWHGNFGILEMRELVKRAATMQYLGGVSPRLIQIHMTNCLLVPAFAFGTSMLSWEDHFGNEIFQKRFSVDYMRAESLGSQVGAESVALDGIHPNGWNEKDWCDRYFTFLTRTQQALLLPAGVKTWMRPAIPYSGLDRVELFKILEVLSRFEIWDEDCEFVAFYENDGAVGGVPKDVLLGTYRKPGKVLAIFGDAGGKDVDFVLKADAAKLGLREPLAFVDCETGKPLEGGRVRLPSWDLRLVEILGAR